MTAFDCVTVADQEPVERFRPTRRLAVGAAVWSTVGYYGTRILSLVATAVLARLLTPAEFGLAGYAFTAMTFLDVVRDFGMGPAVIYVDEEDAADTAFWMGLVAGLLAYAAAWVTAPLVGDLFHDSRATLVVRVLALALPITAIGNIHDTLLGRRLAFRRRTVSDLTISVTRAGGSVGLALAGLGAWALIVGHLAGLMTGVLALWSLQRWRPHRRFSMSTGLRLLRYGGATVSLNTVAKLLVNVDYLFVGRYLGAGPLGLYTLAFRVPELMISDFCTALGRVVFPAYARMQVEGERVAAGVATMTRYVSMLTLPIGVGLASVAEPFVRVFLGDRWSGAVGVTRAIALQSALLAMTYNIGDVYKATGRLALLTRLALVRAVFLLPALWWAAARSGSLAAIAWSHVVVAAALTVFELIVAGRVFRLPATALPAALLPAVTASLVMAAAVLGVGTRTGGLDDIPRLLVGAATGVVVYAVTILLVDRQVARQAADLVTSVRRGATT